MRFHFGGARAFITGGSSGIGRAVAARLIAAGASVVVAARGEERLRRAVQELRELRKTAIQIVDGLVLDISNPDAVRDASHEAVTRLGGIDLVVNNAGIARPGRFEELPGEIFEDMMRVNYLGAVHVTRSFLPYLLERGAGHVSFVSSIAGFLGVYGYTAYGASKFALTGFGECLRQELRPRGIGVSILFPGDTDTPQLAAEEANKPSETRAVAGNVKVLSADRVARAYLDGIARGKFHILPGTDAKWTHFAHRHFPWLVRWVMDRAVRAARG